jgi:hypothetical protein
MCTKKAEPNDPAFALLKLNIDLLLKELLPSISCQPNQPRSKKEHGGGFRHGNGNRVVGSIESLERSPIPLTIATAIIESLEHSPIPLTIATAIIESLERSPIPPTIAAASIERLGRSPISPTIIGGCATPTISMMMMASHAISMICQGEYQNSRNNKFFHFHRFSFSLFLF